MSDLESKTARSHRGTVRRGARSERRLLAPALLCVSLLLASMPAHAQTTDEFQFWGGWFFTGQLEPETPSWRGWADIHVRRGSGGTVLIFRPGVGYSFAPWITLWGGYAWVPTFNDPAFTHANEHRVWEQLTLQHSDEHWLLQSRTRLEQRLLDSDGNLGLRLRQFLRLNYQPWADVPAGLVLWDELFVGMNDPGWAVQGFDQNRLFLGVALYAMKQMRIETGYAFVYLNRQPANQIQHVFAVNFLATLKPD